jgi:lipopolysaccharide biosynthesis glycosyltransferase
MGEYDSSFSEIPSIIHFVGPKPWKEVTQTQFVAEYRENFNKIRLLDSRIADVAGVAVLETKG